MNLRGVRGTAPLQHICVFVFRVSFAEVFKGLAKCRRALICFRPQCRAGRGPQQRERFSKAGPKAAPRLDMLEFRAWLLRRLRNPPLAAPIDPARYMLGNADIALLLKAAREPPGEAAPSCDKISRECTMGNILKRGGREVSAVSNASGRTLQSIRAKSLA